MICVWSSWCHCNLIISCCSKIQNSLPFWCRLTQDVLEKRPLNGCSSSSSNSHKVQLYIFFSKIKKQSPWRSAKIHSRCRCVCSLCYRVVDADFTSINFCTSCHFFCLQSTTTRLVCYSTYEVLCPQSCSESGWSTVEVINSSVTNEAACCVCVWPLKMTSAKDGKCRRIQLTDLILKTRARLMWRTRMTDVKFISQLDWSEKSDHSDVR